MTPKVPEENLKEYKMTQEQMDRVFELAVQCFPIPTKSETLDLLEKEPDKRVALLTSMYIGHMQT